MGTVVLGIHMIMGIVHGSGHAAGPFIKLPGAVIWANSRMLQIRMEASTSAAWQALSIVIRSGRLVLWFHIELSLLPDPTVICGRALVLPKSFKSTGEPSLNTGAAQVGDPTGPGLITRPEDTTLRGWCHDWQGNRVSLPGKSNYSAIMIPVHVYLEQKLAEHSQRGGHYACVMNTLSRTAV